MVFDRNGESVYYDTTTNGHPCGRMKRGPSFTDRVKWEGATRLQRGDSATGRAKRFEEGVTGRANGALRCVPNEDALAATG